MPWFILLLVVLLSAAVAAYVGRTDRSDPTGSALLVLAGGCGFGLLLFGTMLAEVRAAAPRSRSPPTSTDPRRPCAKANAGSAPSSNSRRSASRSSRPDGSVSLANHAWEELWNAHLSDLRHHNVLEDPQLERAGLSDVVRQAFAGQTVMIPPFHYDPAAIGKPGRARWVQLHLYPVKDAGGAVREVVLILHDVSDVKSAEQDRWRLLAAEREARADAETANRTKDEFLATLSHELRTPLNAILGWAQLLQMPGMPREEFQHGLGTIERNAKAGALVEDLLDLSRITSGKLRLDVTPVDLGPSSAPLDSVRPAADAKEIQLVAAIDPCAKPVMGDTHRLQQVVWNLLTTRSIHADRRARRMCPALRRREARDRGARHGRGDQRPVPAARL